MSGQIDSFHVRFRGVRGSYPVPGMATSRAGGNTPCIEVRAGEHHMILDAGTGIIGCGDDLSPMKFKGQSHLVLVITHVHHDHTQGLPFFRPQQDRFLTVHLYGPDCQKGFSDALLENLSPPYFPISLNQLGGYPQFGTLYTGDRIVVEEPWGHPIYYPAGRAPGSIPEGALVLKAYHSPRHPNGGVLTVRVEYKGRSFVYATDIEGVEGGDDELADFARGTDLIIHDAMYTDQEYQDGSVNVKGYGHSTVGMAIDTAKLAGARCLALFHHEPKRSDAELDALEAEARKSFPAVVIAREGQKIELLAGMASGAP